MIILTVFPCSTILYFARETYGIPIFFLFLRFLKLRSKEGCKVYIANAWSSCPEDAYFKQENTIIHHWIIKVDSHAKHLSLSESQTIEQAEENDHHVISIELHVFS